MDFEAEFVEVEALLQHYDLEREFGELKDIPEDIFNTDDFEPQDLGGESRAAPGLHQVQVQVEVQVEVEVARLRARVQALEADNVEKEGAVSLLRSRVSNAERELAAAEARLSGEAARMKEEESRAVERLRREIEALKSEREAQEMEMQEMDRARQALNRALEAERKKGQRSSGVQEGKRKDIRLQESQLDEMEDQFLAFEKPRNMHKQVDVVGTGFSELDSESSAESSIRTKNLETEKKNSSPRASTGLRYSSVMDELCRITSRHFVLKCLEHIYSEVHRVQELKVVSQIFSTVLESELPVHYLLTPINKILQSDIDPSLCLIVLQLLQAICSSDYVSCSVILFGNPKTPPSSRKFSAFSSAHLIEPSEKMELEPLFANAAFRKSRFFFRRNNSASRTSIFLNERPADCRISRDEHYFDHLKISDLRIFRTLTSRITASPSEKEKEIAIASLEILKTCYVRFPPGIQDKELCVKFVEILEGSEIELKVLCLEVLHLLLKNEIFEDHEELVAKSITNLELISKENNVHNLTTLHLLFLFRLFALMEDLRTGRTFHNRPYLTRQDCELIAEYSLSVLYKHVMYILSERDSPEGETCQVSTASRLRLSLLRHGMLLLSGILLPQNWGSASQLNDSLDEFAVNIREKFMLLSLCDKFASREVDSSLQDLTIRARSILIMLGSSSRSQ